MGVGGRKAKEACVSCTPKLKALKSTVKDVPEPALVAMVASMRGKLHELQRALRSKRELREGVPTFGALHSSAAVVQVSCPQTLADELLHDARVAQAEWRQLPARAVVRELQEALRDARDEPSGEETAEANAQRIADLEAKLEAAEKEMQVRVPRSFLAPCSILTRVCRCRPSRTCRPARSPR